MDTEIFIIVLALVSICSVLLSLVFRKNDRIKVIKASALFLGLLISAPVFSYLLAWLLPDISELGELVVNLGMYSLLLYYFGSMMVRLVDPQRSNKTTTDAAPKCILKKQSLEHRRGIALSVLNPVGRVRVDGLEYEARSTLGYISKGEAIQVEGEDGFEVQVRKIRE